MKKLFANYGIEVLEDGNRYFVRYDEGEIVGKMCMMEISEKDALLLQNGEDSAYRVIIKYQNKKG